MKLRTVRRADRRWIIREIGKKLRELREEKGYTLAQVGEGVGVSRAAVNNWELGKAQENFLLGTLYDLALFYDVPIARLLP